MRILAVQRALSPLLQPLSRPYAFFMKKRRQLYVNDIFSSYKTTCPCIAIGNIAVGGTGKTPFTDWLLDWAEHKGLSAVVLSRGYGAKQGNAPVLVNSKTAVSKAGDEPLFLARRHPKATIISFPKRKVSAKMVESVTAPDLILLDDGMQHLALKRDADIILLREDDLGAEWNKVLPAGTWREGASALAGATAFAMKIPVQRIEKAERLIYARLQKFGVPLFTFSLTPAAHNAFTGTPSPTPKGEYLLVSGVGHPQQVEETATLLTGNKPILHLAFADHHLYKEKDVKAIVVKAAKRPILCTEKDMIKLEPFRHLFKNTSLITIRVSVAFGPSFFTKTSFPVWWETWWKNHQPQTDHHPEPVSVDAPPAGTCSFMEP